jgi:hypothetical protein
MSIHVHAPQPIEDAAMVIDCPTCERQRRAHCRLFEWYGASVTCAGCGDRWHDGEREERPFAPGWRQASIRRARAALAAMGVPA